MGTDRDTTWNPFMAQTWNRHRPPVRPSQVVMEFYGKKLDEVIARNSLPDILILGATPELRDLVLSRNLSPVVADYSEVNYRTLALLMKHLPVHETFVNQNWVTMVLDRQFDLIVGDHSLNVISTHSIKEMLYNISRHMKKQALLVIRTWVRPTINKPDLLSVIEEYRETLQPTCPFYPTCVGPVQSYYYDEELESLRPSDMAAQLRKLYEQGKLTDQEWESVEVLEYDKVTLQLYIPLQSDFISLVRPLFRVSDIFYPAEPFSKYCPIFILEKTET